MSTTCDKVVQRPTYRLVKCARPVGLLVQNGHFEAISSTHVAFKQTQGEGRRRAKRLQVKHKQV